MRRRKASGRLRKNRKHPQPCIMIGEALTKREVESLREWRYGLISSVRHYQGLVVMGVTPTEILHMPPSKRLEKCIEFGYDPIFLIGTGWLDGNAGRDVAAIAVRTNTTLVHCPGEPTSMLPQTGLHNVIDWYKDGICIMMNEDIPQAERAKRWLAANGYAMVQGQPVEFDKDLEYLRTFMATMRVENIDEEIKEVERLYDASEETDDTLCESKQRD